MAVSTPTTVAVPAAAVSGQSVQPVDDSQSEDSSLSLTETQHMSEYDSSLDSAVRTETLITETVSMDSQQSDNSLSYLKPATVSRDRWNWEEAQSIGPAVMTFIQKYGVTEPSRFTGVMADNLTVYLADPNNGLTGVSEVDFRARVRAAARAFIGSGSWLNE